MSRTLFTILGLALALGICSCNSERNEPDTAGSQTTEHKGVPAQIEMSLGFDNGLRTLDGLKFSKQWLYPSVSNGTVGGVIIISDGTNTTYTEKEFTYNEATRTIVYKEQINIPTASATSLQMRVIVCPTGWWNSSTKTLNIPEQGMVEESNRNDDTVLTGLKVAYITPWVELNQQYSGSFWYPIESVNLKPIGHVMRITAQDTQSEMAQVKLRGIALETTALSRSGSYNFTGATPSKTLSYTPATTERPYGASTDIYWYTMTLSTPVAFRTAKTYYLWVHPRANVAARHTRGFLLCNYDDMPLDPRRTSENLSWWMQSKRIVASYSSDDFTATGSQTNLRLTDFNALSPISRFTAGPLGPRSANGGMQNNVNLLTFMSKFAERNYTISAVYTYDHLINNGVLASGGVAPTVTALQGKMAMYTNNAKLRWRVPTLLEAKALFPPLSSEQTPTSSTITNLFNIGSFTMTQAGEPATLNETAKLGGKNSATHQYTGTAIYMQAAATRAYKETHAIRWEGNGNRYRTYYVYRNVVPRDGGAERTQVQCTHLGSFYPDITSVGQWMLYKGLKDDIEVEEQVFNWFNSIYRNNTQTMPMGQRVWIADLSADGRPQWIVNRYNGDNTVEEVDVNASNVWARSGSVFLIRDFGDF